MGIITGLVCSLILLIYGLYLIFFKEIISNKDIIMILFLGFAYIGYLFQIYFKKH